MTQGVYCTPSFLDLDFWCNLPLHSLKKVPHSKHYYVQISACQRRVLITVKILIWPLQIVIWWLIPSLHHGTQAIDTKNALRFIITFQYIPRLLRIFPLLSKMINTTGVLLETAWAGAAFNLLLYMLASHVSTSSSSFNIYMYINFLFFTLYFYFFFSVPAFSSSLSIPILCC